jgi:hypothetical protein
MCILLMDLYFYMSGKLHSCKEVFFFRRFNLLKAMLKKEKNFLLLMYRKILSWREFFCYFISRTVIDS